MPIPLPDLTPGPLKPPPLCRWVMALKRKPGPCSTPPGALPLWALSGVPGGPQGQNQVWLPGPMGPFVLGKEQERERERVNLSPPLSAPWCFLQGDVLTTRYQVDLGDGFKAMYMNLTLTGAPIRHRYENPGVYRVSVRAENVAGHDEAVLFVQVNCKSIVPVRLGVTPCDRENPVLGKHRTRVPRAQDGSPRAEGRWTGLTSAQ